MQNPEQSPKMMKAPENRKTHLRRYKGARFIAKLMELDVISPNSGDPNKLGYGSCQIDTDKLLDLFLSVKETKKPIDSERQKPLAATTRQVIRTLVDADIINPRLAALVGRNFRPSLVTPYISGSPFAYVINNLYEYASHDPDNSGTYGFQDEPLQGFDTPNPIYMGGEFKNNREILRYCCIYGDIDPESVNIEHLIDSTVIAHEYGHIVHNTLARIRARKRANPSADPEQLWAMAHRMHYQIGKEISDANPLPDFIRHLTPPTHGAEDTDKALLFSKSAISTERLGMGFEYAYLHHALLQYGVGERNTQSMVKLWRDFHMVFADEYEAFDLIVKKQGMEMGDIILGLKEARSKLAKQLPLQDQLRLTSYNASALGYSFGLREDSLRDFLDQQEQYLSGGEDSPRKITESGHTLRWKYSPNPISK